MSVGDTQFLQNKQTNKQTNKQSNKTSQLLVVIICYSSSISATKLCEMYVQNLSAKASRLKGDARTH